MLNRLKKGSIFPCSRLLFLFKNAPMVERSINHREILGGCILKILKRDSSEMLDYSQKVMPPDLGGIFYAVFQKDACEGCGNRFLAG